MPGAKGGCWYDAPLFPVATTIASRSPLPSLLPGRDNRRALPGHLLEASGCDFLSAGLVTGSRAALARLLADCEVVVVMQPTLQSRSIGIAPEYLTDLDRTLGVLQQIQVLLAGSGDVSLADACLVRSVSLADVARLVLSMQQEFGPDASLESVIQALVVQHLERQFARRRGRTNVAQEVAT
jgi:hypothetical protein